MKLEIIQEKWYKDSYIDESNLTSESLKTPRLHSEYYNIYINEKLVLIKLESDYKKLVFDKYEFYTNGPDEYSRDKGWTLPPKGRLLKAEVNHYIESDKDIIELSLKIGLQKEKVLFLQSIITVINNRGFSIRNSIEHLKFQNGIN